MFDENNRIDDFDVSHMWSYGIDNDDGRIKKLTIRGKDDLDYQYELPAIVCHLTNVVEICLHCCEKLPVELSELPCLQKLELQPTLPFFAWLTKQLPMLEVLSFFHMEDEEIDPILDALNNTPSDNLSFRDTLQCLTIADCKFNENHFETIWIDILPKLPIPATIVIIFLIANVVVFIMKDQQPIYYRNKSTWRGGRRWSKSSKGYRLFSTRTNEMA